jgi:hypothetical protein
VDLRLRIPAAAPFREIAVELAAKFAEYVGASKGAAADVAKAVAGALTPGADPRASVDLLLSAADGDVTVTATPSPD